MTNVYIVPCPPGSSGEPVEHYAVKRQHSDTPLARVRTQREAIKWSCENGYTPHVARVRDIKPDPNNPAHWREASCSEGGL